MMALLDRYGNRIAFLVFLITLIFSWSAMAGDMQDLSVPADGAGRPVYSGLQAVGYTNALALAANTVEMQTIPTGAKYVLLAGTATYYARFDGTNATVPVDTTNGTAAELNPGFRSLAGATRVSVIAPATTIVTIRYFK